MVDIMYRFSVRTNCSCQMVHSKLVFLYAVITPTGASSSLRPNTIGCKFQNAFTCTLFFFFFFTKFVYFKLNYNFLFCFCSTAHLLHNYEHRFSKKTLSYPLIINIELSFQVLLLLYSSYFLFILPRNFYLYTKFV